MTNIEKLKIECEGLLALLNDPHPGLVTWQEAVNLRRRRIYLLEDRPFTPPHCGCQGGRFYPEHEIRK